MSLISHQEYVGDHDRVYELSVDDREDRVLHQVDQEGEAAQRAEGLPRQESVDPAWKKII